MNSRSLVNGLILTVSLQALSCSWYTSVGPARFAEYMTPKVKRQAAFDMQCPESQLSVVQLDATSFGVTGCDRRMSYVPSSNYCSPDQSEVQLNKVCEGLVANVTSTETTNGPRKP